MEKLLEWMDRIGRQTTSDHGRREHDRTAGKDPWRRPFTGECWRCGKTSPGTVLPCFLSEEAGKLDLPHAKSRVREDNHMALESLAISPVICTDDFWQEGRWDTSGGGWHRLSPLTCTFQGSCQKVALPLDRNISSGSLPVRLHLLNSTHLVMLSSLNCPFWSSEMLPCRYASSHSSLAADTDNPMDTPSQPPGTNLQLVTDDNEPPPLPRYPNGNRAPPNYFATKTLIRNPGHIPSRRGAV